MRQKINFLLVGLWNTIFGYLIFIVLYYLLSQKINYLIILIFSYFLSITNAYLGYKTIVFKTRGNYIREYFRFYFVYGATFFVNIILLSVLVELIHISPLIAQGSIIFITIVISYVGHNNFSFKHTSR